MDISERAVSDSDNERGQRLIKSAIEFVTMAMEATESEKPGRMEWVDQCVKCGGGLKLVIDLLPRPTIRVIAEPPGAEDFELLSFIPLDPDRLLLQ